MSEPKYLYHYTNFEGLMGIIEKQSLWLSNSKCVSDTKEFMHSEELIKVCIEEALNNFLDQKDFRQNSTEEFVKKFIEERESIYEALLSNLQEAYLFCFCTSRIKNQKDGLLSMWRGYGEEGGYALVFKQEKVQEYLLEMDNPKSEYPAGSWLECITYLKKYSSKAPAHIRRDYNHLKELLVTNLIPILWGERTTKELTEKKKEQYYALLKLIMFIKHPGFIEEKEYRLCSTPMSKKNPERKIRKHGSSFIDYIEFPLNKFSFKLDDLVKKIIIGPQLYMDIKKKSLERYLKSQGLTKIEVKTSGISYLPK